MKLSRTTRPISTKGIEFDIKACRDYTELRDTIVNGIIRLPVEYSVPFSMDLIRTLVHALEHMIQQEETGVANYKLKNIINLINNMESEVLGNNIKIFKDEYDGD